MAKNSAENTSKDVKDLWSVIAQYSVDKPTTPRQVVDPVAEFLKQLDAQKEAFTKATPIRGAWIKKSKAGRWIIKFGKDPLTFDKGRTILEVQSDDDVLKVFETVRLLAETDDSLIEQIKSKHGVRKERKPRTPK